MRAIVLVVLLGSSLAAADPADASLSLAAPAAKPQRLGLFAGLGFLEDGGRSGAAFLAGLRYSLSTHVALGFDLGWGAMVGRANAQDRWWLIPSIAVVVPTRHVRFDLGGGVGLGDAAGYPGWSSFAAAPFEPAVAYQLFPVVRAHAVAAVALSRGLDAFLRLDVGTVVLDDAVGIRTGVYEPGLVTTSWIDLSIGCQFRLL
jgi:hypothetical protein